MVLRCSKDLHIPSGRQADNDKDTGLSSYQHLTKVTPSASLAQCAATDPLYREIAGRYPNGRV